MTSSEPERVEAGERDDHRDQHDRGACSDRLEALAEVVHRAVRVAAEPDAGEAGEEDDPAGERRDERHEQREQHERATTAPNSAPPTAPIPPTTVSAKIGRPVTRSKFCGVIDESCDAEQRATEPGHAGRDREHRELRAEQVQAEGRARGLAVLHGEQAPAEAAPADRDRRAARASANATAQRAPSASRVVERVAEELERVDRDRARAGRGSRRRGRTPRSSGSVKTQRSSTTANAAVPSAR